MDLRRHLDQLSSESNQSDFLLKTRDEPSHNIVKVETIGNGGSLVRLSKLVYCSDFFRRGFSPIATISTNNQSDGRQVYSVRDAKLCMKPKRTRTSFTASQLQKLEEEFRLSMYVVGVKRMQLASNLNLSEKQVKVWFQNRRMKYKRERAKERGQSKENR